MIDQNSRTPRCHGKKQKKTICTNGSRLRVAVSLRPCRQPVEVAFVNDVHTGRRLGNVSRSRHRSQTFQCAHPPNMANPCSMKRGSSEHDPVFAPSQADYRKGISQQDEWTGTECGHRIQEGTNHSWKGDRGDSLCIDYGGPNPMKSARMTCRKRVMSSCGVGQRGRSRSHRTEPTSRCENRDTSIPDKASSESKFNNAVGVPTFAVVPARSVTTRAPASQAAHSPRIGFTRRGYHEPRCSPHQILGGGLKAPHQVLQRNPTDRKVEDHLPNPRFSESGHFRKRCVAQRTTTFIC